jgi:cholesterol oxidase
MAESMGKGDYFHPTKVAVFFGDKSGDKNGDKNKTVDDPYFNGKGPNRTGCNTCGACMTGCKFNAKNTLDKNYLHLAQQLGAVILAEHEVTDIIPNDETGESGYQLVCKSSTKFFAKTKTLSTKGVIFSGGVLGTVPLLLKLKDSSLPNLSEQVGNMVRSNNESLTLNTIYKGDLADKMSEGIAIGSILELDENSHVEPVRYGKGSGFWSMVVVPVVNQPNFFIRNFILIFKLVASLPIRIKTLLFDDFSSNTSILLFMQSLDSTLQLKKGWLGVKTAVKKSEKPTAFISDALNFAEKYAKSIGAKPSVMLTESITGIPSTAHILGGACMGKDRTQGVIDKNNQVFGYKNMYVFDGSMISANPGVNPSLSITAISEYGMSKVVPKQSK